MHNPVAIELLSSELSKFVSRIMRTLTFLLTLNNIRIAQQTIN